MVDTTKWQAPPGTPRGPAGGYGPPCDQCGVSTWVELAGGPSDDSYHPNIDRRALPDGVNNVDVVHDLREGIPLHDEHAERLKMMDVFNYFTQTEADKLLAECLRVLRPGRSFFLRVLDLPFICQCIVEDGVCSAWLGALYHTEDMAEGPNGEGWHKTGYSYETLKAKLEDAGFVNVTHWGFYNRAEMKIEAWKPGPYLFPPQGPNC